MADLPNDSCGGTSAGGGGVVHRDTEVTPTDGGGAVIHFSSFAPFRNVLVRVRSTVCVCEVDNVADNEFTMV